METKVKQNIVTIEEQLKHFKENWKIYYSVYPGQYAVMMECKSPTPLICRDADEIRQVAVAVNGPDKTSYYKLIKIPGRISGLMKRVFDNPNF